MCFSNIFFFLCICCLGIYLYFYKKLDLFQQSGIPYTKPWPIFGNMLPILLKRISISDFLLKMYYMNPDAKYVGYYEFTKPVILLRDPEIIKSIGVTNFQAFPNRRGFNDDNQEAVMGKDIFSEKNEKWHEMRKLLAPSYTSKRMKILLTLISQQAENFLKQVLKEEKEAVDLHIKKWIQKFLIDTLHVCNYGITTNCVQENKEDIYDLSLRATDMEELEMKKLFLLMSPFLWKIFGMSYLENRVINYFRNIVESAIEKRQETNKFPLKVIDLLIDASYKKKMSMKEMTAQAYIFFAAGLHTTSITLTYICYNLAVHPETQERLQEEIISLQNKCNETSTEDDSLSHQPTLEDINNLKFLDAVIKESMRLYTFIPLERICSENFELPPALPGSKSFTVKPGMLLMFPTEALHLDPNYFEDPKKFNPDRFFEINSENVSNSSTMYPFGMGPRQCIGNRLALLIMKVFLFHILAKCDIKTCSETPIPLNMSHGRFFKTSEKEIWLRIEKRKF